MMNKIHYGSFRKVDTSIGREVCSYAYGDILFHFSKRIRLYDELISRPELKLYCSCCSEDQLEIKLTDTFGLEFVDNTNHSKGCAAYIRSLDQYINRPGISPFSGQTNELPVSFRWKKGSRVSIGFITNDCITHNEGRLALDTFVAMVNIRAFENRNTRAADGNSTFQESNIINDVLFEFGKYRIIDPKGDVIYLDNQSIFRSSQEIGTTSFLYARILEVNDSYKSKVYLLCEHANGKTNISVDRTKWDTYIKNAIIENLPLFICGFVSTKEVSIFTRGRYDSKTHSVYKSTETKTRVENILSSFVVFHANDYGLICFSQEEYCAGNKLARQGIYYEKPYYPIAGLSSLPLLQVPTNEGIKIFNNPCLQTSDGPETNLPKEAKV